MSFKEYIKDKLLSCLVLLFSYIIIFLILVAFKTDKSSLLIIMIILFVSSFFVILIEYFKKKKFYTDLLSNIDNLDKAYLVLETINKPEFYEGKLLYKALYEINKSMCENVKKYEEQTDDFKEYIEMWIHEVKIPLASLVLFENNHKDKLDKKIKKQLRRLENYLEQVLYYVRSENAEKDYYIKEVNLKDIIKKVGLKNMDDLLEEKIEFKVLDVDYKVMTDSKWLEFILEQIINNSIKYKRNIKNSYIKIYTSDTKNKTTLIVEDNGIGIPKSDLNQVFDKTFTGQNGREKSTSTGMGLFIANNLCKKLGHKIKIESEEGKYTRVLITIGKSDFYEVVK